MEEKYFLEQIMNKNFKVVFSKARNALMVVNEVTSSVQAKGTKTVIAAAVAAVAAGAAAAADVTIKNSMTDVTVEKNKTAEVFAPSAPYEQTTVTNLKVLGSVTADSGLGEKGLTLEGANSVAAGGSLDLTASTNSPLVVNGTLDNDGKVAVKSAVINGTLKTGLFEGATKDSFAYANHFKFDTLTLNEGGKVVIDKIGNSIYTVLEQATGEKDLSMAKGDIGFSDGTLNFNGGSFALLDAQGNEITKPLNVYVLGTNDSATVNFNQGDYTFGTVEVLGKSNVAIGQTGKDLSLTIDKLTLSQTTGDNKIQAGTVSVNEATISSNLTMAGEEAVLNVGKLTSSGTTTLTSGALNFVTLTQAPDYQINVAGGTTTFGEKLVVEQPMTISVTGNSDAATKLSIQNDVTVTKLNVNQGQAKQSATVEVEGALTLDGALTTDQATQLTVKEDAQLNLTANADLKQAAASSVDVNGVVSTSSDFFKTAQTANPTTGLYEANAAIDATGGTISFTDDAMSLEQIGHLRAALSTASSFEILASTVTDKDGKAITEYKLADWGDFKGSTMKNISAVASVDATNQIKVNDGTNNPNFGAKNLLLDNTTADQTVLVDVWGVGEMTLVGGAQGTKLIDVTGTAVAPKATNIKVNGTVNFGAANAEVATYGYLNGFVQVGDANTSGNNFNVRNGDFELAQYLDVQNGTATVEKTGSLTVHDVTTTDPDTGATTLTEASLQVAAGKTVTVEGVLNAETVENAGALSVNGGKLTFKDFKEGSTGTFTVAGTNTAAALVVMTGTPWTPPVPANPNAKDEGLTFNLGTNVTVKEGALFVAGDYAQQAQVAYDKLVAANEAEVYGTTASAKKINMAYIGERSTFAKAFSLSNSEAQDDVLVVNLESVAANGFVANGTDAQQIVSVKDTGNITADAVLFEGLNSQVITEIDGKKFVNLGDVNATDVDFGTVFYADGHVDGGYVEVKANEETMNYVEAMQLHSFGAIANAVNAVEFGSNPIADKVIFGLGGWYGNAMKSAYDQAKAAGMLEDGTSLIDLIDYIDGNAVDAVVIKAGSEADFEKLLAAVESEFVNSVREAEHAATNMAVLGGAFSTSFDINDQIRNTIDRRSSLANLNVARNATGITPWVDVMGTWNTADGLYGSSGYEADIYGATLGADYTASCGAILGAAISIGQADANSVDDSTKVDNDVDFWGVSIYGSHRIGNVNGKFDIGYVSTSNDLSAHSAYFGRTSESLDADIFTVGVGAEYLATVGSLNVVPHAGIRWSSLDMDDSKYGADYDKMNLFQMPIGVAFSGTFDMTGWKVAPMLDISVVPTFGDKDAVASYTGGIKDTVRVVDSNPVQMTLGVNATVDAWTLGVNYGLSAGSDERLNNAFNFNARYTF